ncbi:U4/U6.U5 tri-snRNP-associated protein 1 [Coelomomyces lativittatus]|nr:U4/U6.U5 tri-snRNP-associated protein 1 [Coelomomyces lativittatus]KAJ1502992.1 U4/U6.U5 tri-snRNP-associated protein 1 [Coelomomyces lativittatus]
MGGFEGHLAPPDPDKLAREREYADRLEWGLAHPTSKDKSKSAMKARIKDQVSKFRDYKPGINLDYFDDHGRVLSTKEAYRQLSHRFHGRSSGKNKQEKLMRKEEERRRMLHMAGGDTPLQLASAMLDKQMALGTPGILLSVGSRPASLDSASKK